MLKAQTLEGTNFAFLNPSYQTNKTFEVDDNNEKSAIKHAIHHSVSGLNDESNLRATENLGQTIQSSGLDRTIASQSNNSQRFNINYNDFNRLSFNPFSNGDGNLINKNLGDTVQSNNVRIAQNLQGINAFDIETNNNNTYLGNTVQSASMRNEKSAPEMNAFDRTPNLGDTVQSASMRMAHNMPGNNVFDRTVASVDHMKSFSNFNPFTSSGFDKTIASVSSVINNDNIKKPPPIKGIPEKTINSVGIDKTISSSLLNSRLDDFGSVYNPHKGPDMTVNSCLIGGENSHQRFKSYDPTRHNVSASPVKIKSAYGFFQGNANLPESKNFSSNSFGMNPQTTINRPDDQSLIDKRTIDSNGFSFALNPQENKTLLSVDCFPENNNSKNFGFGNYTNSHENFENNKNPDTSQQYNYGGFKSVLSGIAGNLSGFANDSYPGIKQEFSQSIQLNELNVGNAKFALISMLSDLESNLENICRENSFDEINRTTQMFLATISKQNLDKIYDPDKFDDNCYQCRNSKATSMELLGSGGYGTVYRFEIIEAESKSEVVGKMFRINQSSKNEFFFSFSSFLKEWKFLSSFEHENIVKILGVFYRKSLSNDDLQMVGIFLEKMHMSLEECLGQKERLNVCDKILVAIKITLGLKYIHEVHHRIHRDIKPGNIMLDKTCKEVKIIDFGTVSEDILEKKCIMDDAFTITYAPPEFIRYYYLNEKVELNFGSDIWSLGVTLFDIFTSKSKNFGFPWLKHLTDFERKSINFTDLQNFLEKDSLLQEKDADKLQELVQNELSNYIDNEGIFKLIQKCFVMKPEERIKIDDVLKELAKILEIAGEWEEGLKDMEKVKKSKRTKEKTLEEKKKEYDVKAEERRIAAEEKRKKELFQHAVKRKNKF